MKLKKIYHNLPVPAKAAVWITICNVLQKGLSFLALPVYTRFMNTQEYGMYHIFLSWLEIFEIFATFRLGWGGYVVGLTKYEDDQNGYTSSMQILSLLITSVVFGCYTMLSPAIDAFTGLSFQLTCILFGILLFLPAMQFWTQRKRAQYRYRPVMFVSVLMSLITFLGGAAAAFTASEKASAVIVSRLAVQAVFGIFFIWENCRHRFVFYDRRYWKRAFAFNLPLLPYYLSMVLLHSADKIMIQNMVGVSQAGIYGAAYTAAMCMQIFSQAVNQTIQPWMFAQMKAHRMKKVPILINATLLMIAGLNFVFIALAPELITLIAPGEYYEAVRIIPPLSASVVIMYFYQHFINVEFYFEESRLTAAASIGAAVLNILLNLYCIPLFGYYAAGYTTMASYLFFAGIHYLFMKIVCRKRAYDEKVCDIRHMLFILTVFLVLTAFLSAVYEMPPVRYAAVLAAVCVAFRKRNTIKEILFALKNEEGWNEKDKRKTG